MNNQNIMTSDLNDIIFARKNKEYGAYLLRKLYNRHVTIAVLIAVVVFMAGTSAPLIIKYFTPAEEAVQKKVRMIDYTQLSEPPSIDKNQPPPQVEAPPPLKSTIKFLPPVVKPDDQVTDEYVPTVDELKMVDPGTKTEEGSSEGVDYSLIEVEESKVIEEPVKKQEVFTYVEEMPGYPGGDEELMQFFAQNIQYPEIAKRAGVEGRIYATFVVMSDGRITDVGIAKGIGAGCDEEAVRVIRQMPKWKPGRQNGMPVNVKISVPIVFKLQ